MSLCETAAVFEECALKQGKMKHYSLQKQNISCIPVNAANKQFQPRSLPFALRKRRVGWTAKGEDSQQENAAGGAATATRKTPPASHVKSK